MKKVILAALLAACVGPLQAADPPKNAFALMKEARAAYDRGDLTAFLRGYEAAARQRSASGISRSRSSRRRGDASRASSRGRKSGADP